jgi:hypothetical protein
MKKLVLAFFTSVSLVQAQTTPPATPAGAVEQKPAEVKAEKVKPFSPSDKKFARKISEIAQFQLKLAERARGLKEKDPALAEWAGKKQKEITERWTPFATMCSKYEFSDVATDVSKKESADIAKLAKVKEDKFRVEYLELFAKEAKAAFKDVETAPKMVQNAELKSWAEGFVTVLKTNAEEIEAKYKEEKKRK